MADPSPNRFQPYRLNESTLRRQRQRPELFSKIERCRRAVQLKEGGMAILDIGLELAADPSINRLRMPVPSGYGWWLYQHGKPPISEKKLKAEVRRDLKRAHEMSVAALAEESELELRVSLGRCDRMLQALWPHVLAGSQWHVFRALQVEERRAKLWGWDSEKRVVDQTVHAQISAPTAQIEYTPAFVREMFDVLLDAQIVQSDEARELLAQLDRVEVDADVIDVDPVPETVPDVVT